MKICIVGASGYIGSYLSRYFDQLNYEVLQVVRNHYKDNAELVFGNSKILFGDITSKNFVDELLEEEFDFLVYCVSMNHFRSQENLAKSIEVNVEPFSYLTEKLSVKSNFKRIIYFSTMQVYGQIPPGALITESLTTRPANIYGLTHLICEDIINYYKRNNSLSGASIRLSNGYGFPELSTVDCWWLVVNDLCQQVVKTSKIILKSDGSPQRDFIHLSDIAKAVELILNSQDAMESVYNVASSDTFTMLELARMVSIIASNVGIENSIELPVGADINQDFQSLNKFKIGIDNLTLMGFSSTVSLEDGIRDIITRLSDKEKNK
jgi:UDP-glucose 4-epimerase